MNTGLAKKYEVLLGRLRELESLVIAFSGGVDSTVLLAVAAQTLGPDNVLAAMGRSPSVPEAELAFAEAFARDQNVELVWISTTEFDNPNYTDNPADRCYFCKEDLYGHLAPLADARALNAVANGANADDLQDYRPGLRAAAERSVVSPLSDAGLSKADVREIARDLGLSVADKPASPCLSSRIPYGDEVTPAKLRQIDQAETFLRELGFLECRVRHHGQVARIEVHADAVERLIDAAVRERVVERLRSLGFLHVAVDLQGFRSGSLNEAVLGPGLRHAATDDAT